MGRIEELAARYRGHISAPWQRNLAGDQKTIFVVYQKTDERELRARLEQFEVETKRAQEARKEFSSRHNALPPTVAARVEDRPPLRRR